MPDQHSSKAIDLNDPSDPKNPKEARFETDRILTIASGHAVHDTYTAFLPPLLPALIEKFTLTKTDAGLLTFFIQTPSLLQPVIGNLADRRNLRILVILAPAVSATMMSLLGIAPNFTSLAVLLTIAGLSSASFHAIGPVITGKYAGKNLGRGMGIWMVGGELGRTLGPIVIVSIVSWFSMRGTAYLMFFGWFASAILFLKLRNASEIEDVGAQGLPWRSAIRKMKPILIPLAGIMVGRAFVSFSLTTFLPTLLTEEGTEFWIAGASLTILEAAGVVGALLGGSISDRLGRRSVLLFSFAVTPVLMFIFIGVKGWPQIPVLVLLGLTALSVTPVLMALVQESYPENKSLANGVFMALSSFIRSIVVIALGALGDFIGLSLAFRVSAVLMLVAMPIVFLLPMKNKSPA
jgi:FSR family fosmidomycin resistance protein-like MFS transporter